MTDFLKKVEVETNKPFLSLGMIKLWVKAGLALYQEARIISLCAFVPVSLLFSLPAWFYRKASRPKTPIFRREPLLTLPSNCTSFSSGNEKNQFYNSSVVCPITSRG
jgi:hypothetical protein